MVLMIKIVSQPCCFPLQIETFTKDVIIKFENEKLTNRERNILFSGRIIMIWFYLYRKNWKEVTAEFSGMQGLVSFDALKYK